jgi:hypothetical protein
VKSARTLLTLSLLVPFAFLIGCDPEVGSDAWCKAMKEKPQGDWTFNETADFTKHCVIAGLKSD